MSKKGKLQTLFLILFIFPLTAQVSSVTSEGYLRDWQYDGDHVMYSTENGTVNAVITSDEERLILRKYDEKHRLTSEVVWGPDYTSIISETEWTYPETGVYPESMIKKLPGQKQKVCVLYSASGHETERSVWLVEADDQQGTPVEKTVWQYDAEDRVICMVHETSASDSAGNESLSVERTEYTYTGKASDPDMMYYENDVLVEKIVRSSDATYTDSLFFEDMEIRVTWTDGVKTDEVYFLAGKEIKRNGQ